MPGDEKTGEVGGGGEGPFELESQFILRLPGVPAASLKAAVRSGVMNLKDRLTIQLETDMRHGKVRFDGWSLPAKVVDLPAIIESHKTLDRKNYYKTADISQMMICKEEVEEEKNESLENKKEERKDGKDRKFLWPHGITQPLKNVRKKRFRKTLKKKFVDVPEIEKEVKRLFRTDNEAIHVRYEVVNADDEKLEGKHGNQVSAGTSALTNNNSQSMDIAEHDLFGEVLSSSDEEDTRAQDSDDASRLSASNKFSSQRESSLSDPKQMTEFPKGMLTVEPNEPPEPARTYDIASESSTAAEAVAGLEEATASNAISGGANDLNKLNELNELSEEIASLQSRRQAQELEIASIENMALKQRFQSIINSLKEQEAEKRNKYEEILMTLDS